MRKLFWIVGSDTLKQEKVIIPYPNKNILSETPMLLSVLNYWMRDANVLNMNPFQTKISK